MPRDLLENITQPRDLLADEPRDLLVEDSRPRPVKIPSKLSLLGQTLKSTGQDIINYPKFAGEQYKKAGQSLKELPSYLNEPVPSQYSDVYTPRWHNLIEVYGPIALLFVGGVAGNKDIKTKIQWNKTIAKI